jgi:hypothetical protein
VIEKQRLSADAFSRWIEPQLSKLAGTAPTGPVVGAKSAVGIKDQLRGVVFQLSSSGDDHMRSVLAAFLIGYLVGVGIVLVPTIRSTPATYLAASVGREMPHALAWPARIAREAVIGDDTPVAGPRPPEG